MKGSVYLLGLLTVLGPLSSQAATVQSRITEVEGVACLGDDRSRKETRQAALADAQRKASEFAVTWVESRTKVEDLTLKEDLISAYSKARVEVIRELDRTWYEEPGAGLCYQVKIQAEVIPHDQDMAEVEKRRAGLDNPELPLQVRIWTDKKQYRKGEQVKVYLTGTKPFYARVIHRDADGELLQLLPNPYRKINYFEGGVTYQVPSGPDRFELEVTPPFGREEITVYASTEPVGEVDVEEAGPVYAVRMPARDIRWAVRGIKIRPKRTDVSVDPVATDFVEAQTAIRVSK